ncbi:Rubrerythrin [Evansella caseinilytica]|uniref:Rubrerythrin n=1 Tax=Evansella caseinilytica TaxID=1503961 RepID=A0A1H3NQ89_9BACI|nr:ferritin-like domain-containing protein [Evansella caseinilytica]SDY91004.1 Rubrerythrin [Evansella caseinilytica]
MYSINQEEMKQFLADLQHAINGEYSAVECYGKMAGLASNQKEQEQILEIRQDEKKHLQQFMQIYAALTGKQYQPKITEECPANYRLALLAAFEDEQNTTDFYHELADRAPQAQIRKLFRRAAADEQHHAVWFLSYLTIR